MLLSSRDKALYLTLISGQCHWLLYNSEDLKFGHFPCDLSRNDWHQHLLNHLGELKLKLNRAYITFNSESCRFAILPAQQIWPDQGMLQFMAQQIFKKDYPNYESEKFVIVNDGLKFDRACLLMAIPNSLYQGLNELGKVLNIVEAQPALVSVLNRYMLLKNTNDLVFMENKFSFKVTFLNAYPARISVLPVQVYQPNTSDIVINLKNIGILRDGFSSRLKQIIQSNTLSLPEEQYQYLNLMSIK